MIDRASSPNINPEQIKRMMLPPTARFVLAFLLVAAALFIGYHFFQQSHAFSRYLHASATAATALLRLVTQVEMRDGEDGAYIIIQKRASEQNFVMIMAPACSALPAGIIFIAAVLSFPARIPHKLIGVLLFTPVIEIINILRVSCLGMLGAFANTNLFDIAHIFIWQAILVVLVALLWLLWLRVVVLR